MDNHVEKLRELLVKLGYRGNGITFNVLAMKMMADARAGRPNKFLEYLKVKG